MIRSWHNKQKVYLLAGALVGACIASYSASVFSRQKFSLERYAEMINGQAVSVKSMGDAFPQTIEAIDQVVKQATERADHDRKQLLEILKEERTFANTAQFYDRMVSFVKRAQALVEVGSMVNTDSAVRAHAQKASQDLESLQIDRCMTREVYQAFQEYVTGNYVKEKSSLSDEARYYIQQAGNEFIRQGCALPADKYARAQELKREVSRLSLAFSSEIVKNNGHIAVAESDLTGVDPDFVAAQARDENGLVMLKPNYPTVFAVMGHCTSASVRRDLYRLFKRRGYPNNGENLNNLIAHRDQLARLIGDASFGHYELKKEMVKTPERAETFIRDLISQAAQKADDEFAQMTAELPEGVALTKSGKLHSYDVGYVQNYYKKKHFNFDSRKVAEYFSVEQTMQGIFAIYQDFLSLDFVEEQVSGLWHDTVRMISVYRRGEKNLLGRILLDLYPRDGKYSHACYCPTVPALKDADGNRQVSLGVVIANFPQSMGGKPALLTHHDVKTFFHEFGHAMHDLLGETRMAQFSGCNVKYDFVEMPSQILEEWMYDRMLLKQVSAHYKTGESLPDTYIDTIQKLRMRESGQFVVTQSIYSLISLAYFAPGEKKDTNRIYRDIYGRYNRHYEMAPDVYPECAFGHLTEYGPRYYGYLWSKVFALDLFAEIEKHGLRDPIIGKKFIDCLIGRGGSADPNQLLRDFLGREPNQEAFCRIMGIK